MAKKKKSSNSSKKNKSRKSGGNHGASSTSSPKKPVPLEEVLRQAESAMEMSDVGTALQLFAYASGVLRSRVHSTAADGSSDMTSDVATHDNDSDQDRATLSTVMGKMGELKASNGDIEGARSDFLEAVELLGPSSSAGSSSDEKMAAAEASGECNVATAQGCESRAGLHLYLGQLSSGTEALASFRVGVNELERTVGILERIGAAGGCGTNDMEMEGGDEDGLGSAGNMKRFLVETRRQLCAAYCSIAELYLTDLCEEPDAESLCEEALKSALASDEACSAGTNDGSGDDRPLPDALQTMANFRLSQSRVPEALECILKAYDRMRVGCEAMSALVGLGGGKAGDDDVEEMEAKSRELVDVEAASSLPEYNFRCQTAKIMLECASLLADNSGGSDGSANMDRTNQCAEAAIQVLGSLLAENDEVIEVWYLLGCAFMACTPPNPDSANYYWENALNMLTKVKEGIEQSLGDGEDDDDAENELEVIECQIIDVKKKLGKYEEDESESEGDEDMDDS